MTTPSPDFLSLTGERTSAARQTGDRYARHRLMDWWDQKRLAEAKVLVAGAGAIGNEVIKLLALLGVGNLWIVDFDRIEISNLTRSVLFRDSDLGQSKAEVAARRACELNPDIRAHAIEGDLEYDIGLGLYRAMDVVIGCLDSVHARLALNRACYRAGVPWLNGGIEATLGEVALFQAGRGACFECAMSDLLWEKETLRHSCSGLPVNADEKKMPTTAIVASLVASYLVNEALSVLHTTPDAPKQGLEFSQKLYLMLRPYGFSVQTLPHNSECLAHEVWEPIEVLAQSLDSLTPAGLLHLLNEPDGTVELGFDLLTEMRCVQCGETEPTLRPVDKCRADLSYCTHCGENSRQPEIIHWLDAASPLAQTPLSELGIPPNAILPVRTDTGRRFIYLEVE